MRSTVTTKEKKKKSKKKRAPKRKGFPTSGSSWDKLTPLENFGLRLRKRSRTYEGGKLKRAGLRCGQGSMKPHGIGLVGGGGGEGGRITLFAMPFPSRCVSSLGFGGVNRARKE